jgi:hypothetical protein
LEAWKHSPGSHADLALRGEVFNFLNTTNDAHPSGLLDNALAITPA